LLRRRLKVWKLPKHHRYDAFEGILGSNQQLPDFWSTMEHLILRNKMQRVNVRRHTHAQSTPATFAPTITSITTSPQGQTQEPEEWRRRRRRRRRQQQQQHDKHAAYSLGMCNFPF
jgi:hypothetical protein